MLPKQEGANCSPRKAVLVGAVAIVIAEDPASVIFIIVLPLLAEEVVTEITGLVPE